MKKAAVVAAVIGGSIAVVEGALLAALGALAGLADNPESDDARRDGLVVAALGAIVLTTVVLWRRRLLALAAVAGAVAGAGFLVENPLWIFAALFLVPAAVLAAIGDRAAGPVRDRGRRA